MSYVFDTNSISNILNHYYRGRFPSFWEKLDELIDSKCVLSVREARFELEDRFDKNFIYQFVKHSADFFAIPTAHELSFITQIYVIPHFQQNLERKKLLRGGNFADPFIIAKAKVLNGVVVTEETLKDNSAKIPNICQHFDIECVSLEGFMEKENWTF